MEFDIGSAIAQIAREKNVSIDTVMESLKTGLVTAAKRFVKEPAEIQVKVDRDKGELEVYIEKKIVEIINDPEKEITLEAARKMDKKFELGDIMVKVLPIESFGRFAIQTAKQIITQKVREAERDKIFDDYQERIGELITGTVQKIEKGNILVNLGRTEALMPIREQIRKEKYRQGDSIRALIIKVENSLNGAQVILSRTAPEFLIKLFELEVPEIFDGVIEVKVASRDPGNRSKIAVISRDERVDPVGACVGMKGNRVQAIVRELSNERIDIINWNDDITVMVKRTLAPAEVRKVAEIPESNRIVVITSEESLAQAIGKGGQNIRLTSQLVGREIDIFGQEEWDQKPEEEKQAMLSGIKKTEAPVVQESAAPEPVEPAQPA